MIYLFPKTMSEIRKTGGKFFTHFRNEPKDSTTRLALSPHNYEALEMRFFN
jgi:hypothetical protein